jgi:hypothetical protein
MTLEDYLRIVCNWCELPLEGEPVFHEWDTEEAFSFCSRQCRDLMAAYLRYLRGERDDTSGMVDVRANGDPEQR